MKIFCILITRHHSTLSPRFPQNFILSSICRWLTTFSSQCRGAIFLSMNALLFVSIVAYSAAPLQLVGMWLLSKWYTSSSCLSFTASICRPEFTTCILNFLNWLPVLSPSYVGEYWNKCTTLWLLYPKFELERDCYEMSSEESSQWKHKCHLPLSTCHHCWMIYVSGSQWAHWSSWMDPCNWCQNQPNEDITMDAIHCCLICCTWQIIIYIGKQSIGQLRRNAINSMAITMTNWFLS